MHVQVGVPGLNISGEEASSCARWPRYSIHDMSRVQLDRQPPATPRSNMPFEAGLMVGYNTRRARHHAYLVCFRDDSLATGKISQRPEWNRHLCARRIADRVISRTPERFCPAAKPAPSSADESDLRVAQVKKPTSGSVTRAAEGNSHSKVRLIGRTFGEERLKGEGFSSGYERGSDKWRQTGRCSRGRSSPLRT